MPIPCERPCRRRRGDCRSRPLRSRRTVTDHVMASQPRDLRRQGRARWPTAGAVTDRSPRRAGRRPLGAGDPGLIAFSTTKEAWPAFATMGAELLLQHALGARRGQVRRARVHLRHAPDRRSSPSCSPCRSASASPCSSPRSRRAGCASRSSTSIDLLAVVPSVVFGLWGVLVLAPSRSVGFYRRDRTTCSAPIPLLGAALRARPAAGRSSPPASSWPS